MRSCFCEGILVFGLTKTAYGCSFIVLKYWLVTIRELCTHIFQCLICKRCGVSQHKYIRACLKNPFTAICTPHFADILPEFGCRSRYGALIRTKSPTNCDAHLAESLFQTRSRKIYNPKFLRITFASSLQYRQFRNCCCSASNPYIRNFLAVDQMWRSVC